MKFITLLAILFFAFAQPAYAYLDPGTGSIILQAAIGSIAAAMMFGRTFIHNVKSFFNKQKNPSDINASDNKEAE